MTEKSIYPKSKKNDGEDLKDQKNLSEITSANNFKKNKTKKSIKKKILSLVAASAIGVSGFFIYRFVSDYHNSPEYLRKAELRETCNYIVPSGEKQKTYHLDNGNIAIVYYNEPFFGRPYLKITLNGNIDFWSEGRLFNSNLNKLKKIQIRNGNKSETLPREKIKDYQLWQKMYEELVSDIAKAKLNIERGAYSNLKQNLERTNNKVNNNLEDKYKEEIENYQNQVRSLENKISELRKEPLNKEKTRQLNVDSYYTPDGLYLREDTRMHQHFSFDTFYYYDGKIWHGKEFYKTNSYGRRIKLDITKGEIIDRGCLRLYFNDGSYKDSYDGGITWR